MRPRIEIHHLRASRPFRALVLTDTPDPTCPRCDGNGWIGHDYGDHTGEYAGTEYETCHCWNPAHCLTLLPLPRPWRRHHEPTDPWAPF